MKRLQTRLVLITVAVALATMALLVGGLQVMLARSATADGIDLVRARADAAAATVRLVNGRVTVLEAPATSLDQNLWVFDANAQLVDGPALVGQLSQAVMSLGRARQETTTVVADRHRLLARPVVQQGRLVGVVVAGLDLAPYEQTEERSLWYSLVLGVLAVVFAAGVASAATRYSFGKVHTMARTADDWREHDLSRRFALRGPHDELSELGATLDGMLDRIERTILAERRLSDEIAHELRTPLSAIRSEAELGLRDPGDHVVLEAIVAAADRMSESITTMLAVARAGVEHETCTLSDALALANADDSTRRDVRVEVATSGLVVDAPGRVVVAMLRPVLDNAVRHARTVVRVTAMLEGGRVLVTVDDDGPGVADEDAANVFNAGWSRGGSGVGLGLALSRRLAHSVGADIRVMSPGHGRFVVDLPAMRSASEESTPDHRG